MPSALLLIEEQPPEQWYNQQGGKQDCFTCKVRMKTDLALRDTVRLDVLLMYENTKHVDNQNILQMMESPELDLSGVCQLKVRIHEVKRTMHSATFI